MSWILLPGASVGNQDEVISAGTEFFVVSRGVHDLIRRIDSEGQVATLQGTPADVVVEWFRWDGEFWVRWKSGEFWNVSAGKLGEDPRKDGLVWIPSYPETDGPPPPGRWWYFDPAREVIIGPEGETSWTYDLDPAYVFEGKVIPYCNPSERCLEWFAGSWVWLEWCYSVAYRDLKSNTPGVIEWGFAHKKEMVRLGFNSFLMDPAWVPKGVIVGKSNQPVFLMISRKDVDRFREAEVRLFKIS